MDIDAVELEARRPARVYECVLQGVRSFSDFPCAQDAQLREVQVVLPTTTDIASPASKPASASSSRGASTKAPAREPAARPPPESPCIKLLADKRALDARMRSGYGAAEGERLRAEHHRLTGELYRLRCRGR